MVWAPKCADGAATTGLVRESTTRLAALEAELDENIADMTPLWGGNSTVFYVNSPRVSGTYMLYHK